MKRIAGTVKYHNVYAMLSGKQSVSPVGWSTRRQADAAAFGAPNRVACIKVTYK